MDPWVILPQERARHMEQFASAGPVDGFITGAQARTFFMQSGLPPMMLAQVWGLADMNGDGKMDMAEFSVACKEPAIDIELNVKVCLGRGLIE